MEITVQVKGEASNVRVESSDTIAAVKKKIQEQCGSILPCQQRLLLDGRELDDSRTLADNNIQKETTLVLEDAHPEPRLPDLPPPVLPVVHATEPMTMPMEQMQVQMQLERADRDREHHRHQMQMAQAQAERERLQLQLEQQRADREHERERTEREREREREIQRDREREMQMTWVMHTARHAAVHGAQMSDTAAGGTPGGDGCSALVTATPIVINVVPMTGDAMQFAVLPSDSIASVKTKIQEKTGHRPEKQRLQYGDQELADAQPLSAYGITHDMDKLFVTYTCPDDSAPTAVMHTPHTPTLAEQQLQQQHQQHQQHQPPPPQQPQQQHQPQRQQTQRMAGGGRSPYGLSAAGSVPERFDQHAAPTRSSSANSVGDDDDAMARPLGRMDQDQGGQSAAQVHVPPTSPARATLARGAGGFVQFQQSQQAAYEIQGVGLDAAVDETTAMVPNPMSGGDLAQQRSLQPQPVQGGCCARFIAACCLLCGQQGSAGSDDFSVPAVIPTANDIRQWQAWVNEQLESLLPGNRCLPILHDFFLGHRQKDGSFQTHQLYEIWTGLGLSCWLDIAQDDQGPLAMIRGVAQASVYTLYLTREVLSQYVLLEAYAAMQLSKPAIILVDGDDRKPSYAGRNVEAYFRGWPEDLRDYFCDSTNARIVTWGGQPSQWSLSSQNGKLMEVLSACKQFGEVGRAAAPEGCSGWDDAMARLPARLPARAGGAGAAPLSRANTAPAQAGGASLGPTPGAAVASA
jgi:hypothetical protein